MRKVGALVGNGSINTAGMGSDTTEQYAVTYLGLRA